jgi:dTMP kinase
LETLRMILDFATGGLKPDLTLYLDITPEEGLARRQQAAQEGAEWNRLDAQALDFHRRVYAGYQHLITAEPTRWRVVPAMDDEVAIHHQICDYVRPVLRKLHDVL